MQASERIMEIEPTIRYVGNISQQEDGDTPHRKNQEGIDKIERIHINKIEIVKEYREFIDRFMIDQIKVPYLDYFYDTIDAVQNTGLINDVNLM